MANPRPNSKSGGAGIKPQQAKPGNFGNIAGSSTAGGGQTIAQPKGGPLAAALMNRKLAQMNRRP